MTKLYLFKDDEEKEFEETLQLIGVLYEKEDFVETISTEVVRGIIAYLASKKQRFDIVKRLFELKSTSKIKKLAYLIQFYPNTHDKTQQILSILTEEKDNDSFKEDLRNYRHYDGNSLLDLSCGRSANQKMESSTIYFKLDTMENFELIMDYYEMERDSIDPKPVVVSALTNRGMDLRDMHMLDFNCEVCLQLVLFDERTGKIRPYVDSIINKKGMNDGCTALHKAAQRGNQKSVLNLLKAGANFGTTNDFGQSCISQIDPETLETFLNNQCIKVDSRKNHIDDKDFKLIFDYR